MTNKKNGSEVVATKEQKATQNLSAVKVEERKNSFTINQKLEKIDVLYDLKHKRQKLIETKNTLRSFDVSKDENNVNLFISDRNGTDFKTSNNSVLVNVLALINKVIDDQISDVEKQITF